MLSRFSCLILRHALLSRPTRGLAASTCKCNLPPALRGLCWGECPLPGARLACLLCLTCGLATSTTKLACAFDERGQCALCVGRGRSQCHARVLAWGHPRVGVMQHVVSLWFHVKPWQVECVWEVVLLFLPQFNSCRRITSSTITWGRPPIAPSGRRKEEGLGWDGFILQRQAVCDKQAA